MSQDSKKEVAVRWSSLGCTLSGTISAQVIHSSVTALSPPAGDSRYCAMLGHSIVVIGKPATRDSSVRPIRRARNWAQDMAGFKVEGGRGAALHECLIAPRPLSPASRSR